MSRENQRKSGEKRLSRFITLTEEQYRKLRRKREIALFAIPASLLLFGTVALLFAEHLLYLPAAAKLVLISLLLLTTAGGAFLLYRRIPVPTFNGFYHRFSRRFNLPELSDALDLHLDDSRSAPLTAAAIRQNLDRLDLNNIRELLVRYGKEQQPAKAFRAGGAVLSLSAALLLGSLLWQPEALNRLVHAWENYAPPNPYSYRIEPGTITLEQGDSFAPVVHFGEETPEKITLAFKTDVEERYRDRNPVGAGDDSVSFSSLSFNTGGEYYFVMDGFETETHSVNVQLRPRFEQLELTVIPPSYTGLDTLTYSYPFSKVRAHYGSEIRLRSTVNKPVTKLEMVRSSGDTTELRPAGLQEVSPETTAQDTAKSQGATALRDSSTREMAGRQAAEAQSGSASRRSTAFRHEWELTSADTVSFGMTDSAGLTNRNRFRFVTLPREDQYPFVDLVEPGSDLQMKSPEKVALEYEAGDDFGLTGVSLRFELSRAFTDRTEEGTVTLPVPSREEVQSHVWDLPALDPKPRDRITFWVLVSDNDPYNGPKTTGSQKRTITLPSMTEYLDELDEQESDVSETLQDVSESYEQVQQEYERFKERLKQNPDADWEQKQELEQIGKQQEEVERKVEELNKKFEQMRREIEKSGAMSPETMKSYNELQKLMKEINDPELRKALEELQKSLEDISPDRLREAMENYEFNEQQYEERLRRTIELFKSLKLNSDLDKLSMSLEELSEQEQELSESEQSPARDAEQQKSVAEDLERLKQQLERLEEHIPEKAKQRVEELQKEAEKQLEDIGGKLRENIDSLNRQKDAPSSSPETREQQRDIGRRMQQLSREMQDARQQLNSQSRNINIAALRYILYSLINLSENQEELTQETETLPDRSQAFVEKARRERNISKQFNSLSDSLFRVSSEVPAFSNRINRKKNEVEQHLDRAVGQLAERIGSNATYMQRRALGGINELASMIASLLDQIQNQEGAGSGSMTMQQFLEQMKNMSGEQQQLNRQIEELINDIQGDRLTNDQMERLNQLARQQNRIRKQLKELQQNGSLEGGDRVLSELERMSEDMEDAINEIRGGQLDQQLVKRQQNILSRMLNAEEAIQERGKEERREADTAEEQRRRASPDVTMEELQKEIRKMLNDPDRTRFAEDYQRLIEQYFELLRKLEEGQ